MFSFIFSGLKRPHPAALMKGSEVVEVDGRAPQHARTLLGRGRPRPQRVVELMKLLQCQGEPGRVHLFAGLPRCLTPCTSWTSPTHSRRVGWPGNAHWLLAGDWPCACF